jgi:hypothetical protein
MKIADQPSTVTFPTFVEDEPPVPPADPERDGIARGNPGVGAGPDIPERPPILDIPLELLALRA